jgi:tripartite-type tricarboxylate transporter receptor subunit TctC
MGVVIRLTSLLMWGFVCSLAASPAGAADPFPNRPIHWVVGFPAGGPTDTVARLVGDPLSDRLGQQVVVENRSGAGGMIAAASVINAAPDGYELMFVAPNNAIGATLYKNLPFVFLRDTTPVAGMMRAGNVMVVPTSLPVRTDAEFINYAKANPGKVSFASAGNGTSMHMSAELFKMMTGVDMVHVPYRGSAGAYPDLMTGKVQVFFDNIPGVIEFIRAGRLRALGVTTATRSEALPDVPTISETVPGYEASTWYGISGPKGVSSDVVEKLNGAVVDVVNSPKMKARIAELGATPMPQSPAQFGKFVADETTKWGEVVNRAGLAVESERASSGNARAATPRTSPAPNRPSPRGAAGRLL